MKSILVLLIAAGAAAATLPGEVLVLTPAAADTDVAAGIWYLGECPQGNLYLAEKRALSALRPYRVLHDDPETAVYYLGFDRRGDALGLLSEWAEVQPVGAGSYLIAVPAGRAGLIPPGLKIEWRKLEPIEARAPRRVGAAAEEPPVFDPVLNEALQSLTSDDVKAYIGKLQGFQTRYSYTQGYENSAAWVRELWEGWGYDVEYDQFFAVGFDGLAVPGDGRKAWVSTDGGTVYYTPDGGATWGKQTPPSAGFLWSVDFIDDNRGWAVGAGGTVVTTANGGQSWSKQAFPYAGSLFGVDFVNASVGYVVGDEGRVFRTADGGATWTALTSPTTARLYDVSMADLTHGWACGRNGVILRTSDGATWAAQPSSTTQRLYGVKAVSADEAWACGWGKTVLHTTDGGATWTAVPIPQAPYANLYGLDFIDAAHGFVAGTNGVFASTADGGATWTYNKVGNEYLMACEFADAAKGYVAGSGALYRTDDGGATWSSLTGNFTDLWKNVVAEKKGVTRPDEIVIICGHMDSTSEQPLISAPGADDNGSGSAATVAAAELLSDLRFDRTLRFIVWCGEEQGLLGSMHYAAAAAQKGEKIVGVVNLDMVAYDEEGGARDDTSDFSNAPSEWLGEYFNACAALYVPLHHFDHAVDPTETGSDHASFWGVGYNAILLIEGEKGEGGVIEYPYYHTSQDTLDKLDMDIQRDVTRAAIATVVHLARPRYAPGMTPSPLPSPPPTFRVFPNPLRVGGGLGCVRFEGLSGPGEVRVFDLAGTRVFSQPFAAGETGVVWDAGPAGVASGVYVYRVVGAGQEEVGKVAVIR